MSRFETYFEMSPDDIVDYVLEKTPSIDWDRDSLKAIVPAEHGNLNYVFHVSDAKGNSIYVKQAGLESRISKDMKPSRDRNRLESEILELEDTFAPGMVPHVFFYDTVMCACGMEDCSDFEVMRAAMLKHEIFPRFAEDISTFMVNTLLLSSDVVLDHCQKKEYVKQFISPDLCDITEKLVLMEPYADLNHRNNVFPPNADFVREHLYNDEALHLEVAKLKFRFMTDAQALVHGDLHTGSIFVKKDATKVFDSEFGTYAPMGYDTGNIVANLIFSYVNGLASDDTAFCSWVLETIAKTVDLFIEKFDREFDERCTEPMARTKGFKKWYIDGVLDDTAGYAGTELHRRTVGLANVVDVTSIKDEKKRLLAERINILVGKNYIMHQSSFRSGDDFVMGLREAQKEAEATL
ncbi:5'-methylthioribose kinase [Coriobacterium glomerans PW2]|uniref:5'-methylthioribose kinase n=1 Tax=Coriobacterium glomerans (strain ATCC 49209 / DSM 20642 / JCM 10262 / PW2) TaxID=700015 RepID=F2NBE1_CORGP|nr:S-methyl-5-thioribose kinase [Coriobacterium glomerans]AEB06677.1 5'-methylthioribose kinase [Coriobacterium glomerans PW2]